MGLNKITNEKFCIGCGNTLDVDKYYILGGHVCDSCTLRVADSGLGTLPYKYCTSCRKKYPASVFARNSYRCPTCIKEKLKRCKYCGEVKKEEEFYETNVICKDCYAEHNYKIT